MDGQESAEAVVPAGEGPNLLLQGVDLESRRAWSGSKETTEQKPVARHGERGECGTQPAPHEEPQLLAAKKSKQALTGHTPFRGRRNRRGTEQVCPVV
jgi:hypothetical protein